MRYTIFIFICLTSMAVLGQSMRPKGSFQTHVGLPVNLKNESFKGFMQGLVTISSHYQYSLKSGFGFGVGATYEFYDINEFKAPEPAVGGMHAPSLFFKIGREKIVTRNFGTDIGLRAGYSMISFRSDLLDASGAGVKIVQTGIVEPTFSIIMLGEDLTSFKFTTSYRIYGTGFQPRFVGMDTDGGYNVDKFDDLIQGLTFSFGYVHYFRMH